MDGAMNIFDDPALRDFPDRAIRQALQHPEHLQTLLQQAIPELADHFDCQRRRLLDREFPLEDWRRREADLPFEIPFRREDGESWALVVVLIEHQSASDPLMPLRLLYFAVLYWDRQWRQWAALPAPRPPLRLHPVLPIVLYTGLRDWNGTGAIVDLLDEPTAFHAFAPAWKPLFWNLGDSTPEALLASADEWLQTLAVLRSADADADSFRKVFGDAVRKIASLAAQNEVRWHDLMRILLTWLAWRRKEAERLALIAEAVASQSEVRRQKEVEAMSNQIGATLAETVWAKAEAEGIAKGRQEGEAKGRQEGEAKGKMLALRESLRALLEERFTTLAPEVIRRIEGCDDPDRLRQAVRQALHVEKPDQLAL